MKQFLRYQISGLIFITWCFIYFYGKNDWNIIEIINKIVYEKDDLRKVFKDFSALLVIVALPIGVLIHQLSVMIKNWLFSLNNKTLIILNLIVLLLLLLLPILNKINSNYLITAIVVIILIIIYLFLGKIKKLQTCPIYKWSTSRISIKEGAFSDFPSKNRINKLGLKEDKNKIVEYCLERISNLNSFYYVRFDNGILAPFLAISMVEAFNGTAEIKGIIIIYSLIIGFITSIYIIRIRLEILKYNKIIKEIGND